MSAAVYRRWLDTAARDCRELEKERDALRAELDALKASLKALSAELA
jgi:hypothetical protein